MKKYILTIILIWSGMCIIPLQAQKNRLPQEFDTETYRERMEIFSQENSRKFSTIFLGNSLTQAGEWEQYFPNLKPINRGISGDNTAGVLNRLADVTALSPEKLFILIGVNDISQNYTNAYLLNQYKKIIAQIKAESPDTQIYFQSLLPINNDFGRYSRLLGKERQIKCLNRKIKRLCKKERINYIDLYPFFLESKRKLNAELTTDGLHLNEEGYEVWVRVLKIYIR